MIELEKHFAGKETWTSFFETCKNSHEPQKEEFKKLLEILDNEFELATVIYYRCGKHSIEWLDAKIPALDYLKPTECLKNKKLTLRLKECLLRMHQ